MPAAFPSDQNDNFRRGRPHCGDTQHARTYLLTKPNDKISFTSDEIFHDSRSKVAAILRRSRRATGLPARARIYCFAAQGELLRDK